MVVHYLASTFTTFRKKILSAVFVKGNGPAATLQQRQQQLTHRVIFSCFKN